MLIRSDGVDKIFTKAVALDLLMRAEYLARKNGARACFRQVKNGKFIGACNQ